MWLLHGLPIVHIDVVFLVRQLHLENVLLDTGLAGIILDADKVAAIGGRVGVFIPLRLCSTIKTPTARGQSFFIMAKNGEEPQFSKRIAGGCSVRRES